MLILDVTVVAIAVLLMYTQTVGHTAGAAGDGSMSGADLRALGTASCI